MRRGKLVSCGILAVLVVFMATVVVMAQQKAPDTITLKEWPNPTKAPVQFSHKKHAEEYKDPCNGCHHVYKDGKNVWKEGDPVEKCSKCHTNMVIEGEKKLSPEDQKLNLKLAFHGDCQGCHQKLKKEKPDTKAPVVCTGCHPAQK
jgi:hypothetical protein